MNEMLYYAYRSLNYYEMLVKQCDNWLSEEEGIKSMEKEIKERARKKRKEKTKKAKEKILKFIKKYKSLNIKNL
jgi:DNA/RNA-binding domain of Phe-tRNA-synthetase-like protein